MANSPLVTYNKPSKNTYGPRTHAIDTFIPHVIVGQCNTKRAGDIFSAPGYKYSCTYALGNDGGCALVLDEKYAPITTSSFTADNRAITIEIASDTYAPYKITNAALDMLIKLAVDCCRRYGKNKLVWIADKAKNKAYEPKANEMKLSAHRFYSAKACPGDYLIGLYPVLVERVNTLLAGGVAQPIPTPVKQVNTVAKPIPTVKTTTNTFDVINSKFNGVDMKPVYDFEFYYRNYPDLQKALGYDRNKLFQHFCTNGMKEARQAIATFNPVTYKANYADLANLYKNEWIKYYQHYLLCGNKEGRKGV